MTPYLRRRARSVAEYREEVIARIAAEAERIRIWAAAIDNASDEMARLEGRLDALDDALGTRVPRPARL